jgi:hypothetical protein
MKTNTIITLLAGLSLFLLFDKYGKKRKDCGCKGDSEVEPENSSDAECEEAVDMIMNERMKTMKMSKEGFETMREEELEKCKNS